MHTLPNQANKSNNLRAKDNTNTFNRNENIFTSYFIVCLFFIVICDFAIDCFIKDKKKIIRQSSSALTFKL